MQNAFTLAMPWNASETMLADWASSSCVTRERLPTMRPIRIAPMIVGGKQVSITPVSRGEM